MDRSRIPPPIPMRSGASSPSFDEVHHSTRHQTQPSVIEGVAVDLATVLAKTLQDLLRNTASDVRVPLITFSGFEQEDPNAFFLKLRQYFAKAKIEDEDEQVATAARQLRGGAAQWFAPYRTFPLTFQEFQEKLLGHYDNASTHAVLKSKLYGDRQQDNEPVGLFITRKRALFARVDPRTTEEQMICVILELLRSSIRAYLRTQTFTGIEDFTRVVEKIEEDIGVRPSPAPRRPTPTPGAQQLPRQQPPPVQAMQQPSPNTASSAEPRRPPTPCRYCQQWHYHATCPRNPYRQENQRRAGREQTTNQSNTAVTAPSTRPVPSHQTNQ